MRRVLLVARRDYLAAVKNRGFLIGLIVAPVLFGGGFFAVAMMTRPDTKDQRIAIIDHTGVAAASVIQVAQERNTKEMFEKITGRQVMPRYLFETLKPEADADAQRLALSDRVRRGELFLFAEIGPRALDPSGGGAGTGVTYYTNSNAVDELRRWFDGPVNDGLRRLRLARLGVDPTRFAEVLGNVPIERMGLASKDEKTGKIQEPRRRNAAESVGVPFTLMLLLMMIVLIGSSPMLAAVAEDKMQRVFEMLLVSASPFELMMGKVLGALGVSLTGSLFYIAAGVVALQGMALIGLVPFALLPWFFVYLVADVMMLSSLGAALGAACSTPQDAQSLAIFLVAPVVIPSTLMVPILQQPNGALATTMSLIPPFTPLLMLMRQAMPGGVPAWQPWVGLVGVIACTLAMTWGASRIFRVGILLQGKPPRLGELLRWAVRG